MCRRASYGDTESPVLSKELGERPGDRKFYCYGISASELMALTDEFRRGLSRSLSVLAAFHIALMCSEYDPSSADCGVDVADEPVLAADGHDAGHHLGAVAGFWPRLHPSAAKHHRVVDPARPHPDPGDGNPQPDAQSRWQHRHQHSGRNLGPEHSSDSLASGRGPAAGQSARAGALSDGTVQPEHAERDGGAQRRGDAAGRNGRLYR